MLNAGSDVVRTGVCLGRGKIHIQSSSWRVEGIEGVHASNFASVC